MGNNGLQNLSYLENVEEKKSKVIYKFILIIFFFVLTGCAIDLYYHSVYWVWAANEDLMHNNYNNL
jgi:hypothetical protein